MFKKIPSKKGPGVTVFTELQKEFGHYIGQAGSRCRALLSRHPFTIFAIMVVAILLSCVLAFTVMRQQKRLPFPRIPIAGAGPVNNAPGALNIYEAFKEAAYLQSRIEAIARKDTLTDADSTEVVNALKRIDALRHQFKNQIDHL